MIQTLLYQDSIRNCKAMRDIPDLICFTFNKRDKDEISVYLTVSKIFNNNYSDS